MKVTGLDGLKSAPFHSFFYNKIEVLYKFQQLVKNLYYELV